MSETEVRAAQDIGQDEAWAVNLKRLVEDSLTISAEVAATGVESIKRNRAIVDKIVSDAQQFDNQRQVIANQALQNAVETANMVSKQAVRHCDIAIDNEWNPVQQGAGDTLTARAVTIDDASLKALGVLVATTLAEALKK